MPHARAQRRRTNARESAAPSLRLPPPPHPPSNKTERGQQKKNPVHALRRARLEAKKNNSRRELTVARERAQTHGNAEKFPKKKKSAAAGPIRHARCARSARRLEARRPTQAQPTSAKEPVVGGARAQQTSARNGLACEPARTDQSECGTTCAWIAADVGRPPMTREKKPRDPNPRPRSAGRVRRKKKKFARERVPQARREKKCARARPVVESRRVGSKLTHTPSAGRRATGRKDQRLAPLGRPAHEKKRANGARQFERAHFSLVPRTGPRPLRPRSWHWGRTREVGDESRCAPPEARPHRCGPHAWAPRERATKCPSPPSRRARAGRVSGWKGLVERRDAQGEGCEDRARRASARSSEAEGTRTDRQHRGRRSREEESESERE